VPVPGLAAYADQLLFEPEYLGGQRLVSGCTLAKEMVASEFLGSGAHVAPGLQAVVITGTEPEALRKIIDILAEYDVPEPTRPPAPEPTFTITTHLPGPPHHPANRIRLQPNATLSSKRASVRLHTSTTACTPSWSSHREPPKSKA
jgi:hypothetical protein